MASSWDDANRCTVVGEMESWDVNCWSAESTVGGRELLDSGGCEGAAMIEKSLA